LLPVKEYFNRKVQIDWKKEDVKKDQANGNHIKTSATALILDKVDFKARNINNNNKRGYFINVRGKFKKDIKYT
jgi:hypothetical protein